jgi:hypothetical protein
MKQQVEKEGISLPKQYNMIAKEAGITAIDKIKILYVNKIEFFNLQNINLLKEYNSHFENSRGLALGYCVFYKILLRQRFYYMNCGMLLNLNYLKI